jgi:DNA-binding NarL/FixJ family response regulator
MSSINSVSTAETIEANSAPQATTNTVAQTNNGASNNNTQLPQQVFDLYDRGETVPQIAFSLNLSEAAVNSYLALSKTA